MRGAWVKAFSEDWGIMYPHFENWGLTDSFGNYRFKIPVGNWSFIASSGWDYTNTNPNRGVFVAVSDYIGDDTALILKPQTMLTINTINEGGSSLPIDELYAFSCRYIPSLPPALIGRSTDGFLSLSIGLDQCENLTILAVKQPTRFSDGYVLTKEVSAGQNSVTISSTNSASLSLTAYNPDGSFSNYWNTEFRLPNLYLGNWVFAFQLTGENLFHVSPMYVVMNPRFIPPGWYYYFESMALALEANQEYRYSFGKAVSFHLWVIEQDTQLWFDIRDEFENVLAFYSGPDSSRSIRMKIFEGTFEVYNDDIGKYTAGSLFYGIGKTFSQTATFELYVKLGPLGNLGDISAGGLLYEDRNLCRFRDVRSENFNLHIPVEHFWNVSGQLRDRFFVDALETVYASMGTCLGETLQNRPHRVEVNFEWCGVGGTSFVGFGVGVARWPVYVHHGYLGVLSHELGHMYSFTPPLVYYVECPLFAEPLATYLGIESVAALYGSNVRLWYWGTHPGFFDYIAGDKSVGEIERMQFIFFYLREAYKPEIHKQFFKIWNSEFKDVLCNHGFGNIETSFTLYSYLAKENLAWLLQLAGFNISEQRINQGLSLLGQILKLKVSPSTAIPLAEVEMSGVDMAPDSSFIVELGGFDVTPSSHVTDHSGKFNTTIVVPPIVPGEYNISVYDSMRSYEVPFGVERAFEPPAPPSQSLSYLVLNSAAVVRTQRGFQFVMHVNGTIPSNPGSYTAFIWFVDADRNASTGQKYNDIGSDFNVRVYFDPRFGWGATVDLIDQFNINYTPPTMEIVDDTIIMYVPPNDLGWPELFYWVADAFNSQWVCFVPSAGHVTYPREPSGNIEIKTEPVNGPIYIDGFYVNKGYAMIQTLPPGNHIVSFGKVPGYTIPKPIEVTVVRGQTLNITATYSPSSLEADLNGDGTVNIMDVAIVARAFGSKPEDKNWNPIADLDGNGEINIIDVAAVAKQFGKTVGG
jgi:hypothetical protein